MAIREPEVLEQEVSPSLPSTRGGTVDVQITTAKQFPRSIATFMKRAAEMAILTEEVAASCVYAIPRDGKTIEGPSARLAEIVAHAWGNLRIQAGVTDDDGRYVTARGEAWDVESNVAIGFEVKRRITNRKGDTFNDDMIAVTGNAAASIALRNAVFKTVPSAFWRPIYAQCRKVIAGDAKTFETRRDAMLKAFAVMGVTEARLCKALGVEGMADVKLDHIVTLTGYYNALRDGETTIEDAFPEGGGLGAAPQPAQRKSQQAPAPAPQPAAAQATAPAAQPEAKPAATEAPEPAKAADTTPTTAPPTATNIGIITAVVDKDGGAALIKLDTGFQCASRDADVIAAAALNAKSKTRVELVTRPASKPGFAPFLEEIQPAPETGR